MITKIIRALLLLRMRDRIPKLPRAMLAEKYQRLDRAHERVLARLGARSPNGVRVALKRAGVETIPDLVAQLEHFRARRRVGERLRKMVGKFFGATQYHPHQRAIVEDGRRARRRKADAEMTRRIEQAARAFRDGQD